MKKNDTYANDIKTGILSKSAHACFYFYMQI